MRALPRRIETDRLILRHWREDEAADLSDALVASLDHLRPFMSWAALEPVPLEDVIERFRRWDREWHEGGDSVFAIRRDGLVVGACGLHRRGGPDSPAVDIAC